ncbi:MAG: hypothetical protein FWC51_03930, partial [Proteobacteria bacterium]|nr:hypothetical protein [Pseudomonadota bacterium]
LCDIIPRNSKNKRRIAAIKKSIWILIRCADCAGLRGRRVLSIHEPPQTRAMRTGEQNKYLG